MNSNNTTISTNKEYSKLFDNGSMRDARNEDGKTYYVPADMTYRDWEKPKIQNSDGERNTENKLKGRLIMINF